jgi:heat shock protein HslJ
MRKLWLLVLLAAIACKSKKPTEEKVPLTAVVEQEAPAAKPTVVWKANGNEPFWSLETYSDGTAILRQLGQDSLAFSLGEKMTLPNNNGFRFIAKSKKGQLEIRYLRENCKNSMTGALLPYTVAVNFDIKVLNGCGIANFNEELAGEWVLQRINEKSMTSASRVPVLRFDPEMNRVSGNNGCNQITGSFEHTAKTIKFGPIASTRMACPDSPEQEVNASLAAGPFQYSLTGNSLTLTAQGLVLVLARGDE